MAPRLIIRNVEILTLQPEASAEQYLSQATIIIKNSVIEAILSQGEDYESKADDVIDGTDKLAMPGLVDLHFHTAIAQGLDDWRPLHEYLDHCWYPSIRALDSETAYWAAMASYMEAIKSGTTQVNDMYRLLPSLARAAEDIGVRATLSNDIALPEHKLDSVQDNIEAYNQCHNTASGRITVRMGIEWCLLSDAPQLKEIAETAKRLDIGIHTHLNESADEVAQTIAKHGRTPTQLAYDCGVLGARTVAAHCVHLTKEEIDLFAKTGTSVSHNPSSNAKLGNGIAPLVELIEAGVNVGLGHDAAECNNSTSMFQVCKYASLFQRAKKQDASLFQPEQILRMATVNGNKALGTNGGYLAVGKKADLILLDLHNHAFIPLDRTDRLQLMSHLVFSIEGDCVDTSIIDARVVMRGRQLVFADEDEIRVQANNAFMKVKGKMQSVTLDSRQS